MNRINANEKLDEQQLQQFFNCLTDSIENEVSMKSSTNNEFYWCADLDDDFRYGSSNPTKTFGLCDSLNRTSSNEPNGSEISLTMATDNHHVKDESLRIDDSKQNTHLTINGPTDRLFPKNNNHFDIHLAQIDIETFKSEDIGNFCFDQSINSSINNDDTLRIIDSINSFPTTSLIDEHFVDNKNHLDLPPNDNCEALSIDSLDLNADEHRSNTNECADDDEINSALLQKCTENDKTRYKIAMIESSVHSTMNSFINHSNNRSSFHTDGSETFDMDANKIQSPGSLVKLFIQNRLNSSGEDGNRDERSQNGMISFIHSNDNTASEVIGLNTVDSNDLPLHVLDLSKKLRSLNLNRSRPKKSVSGSGDGDDSTSMSSYTSTTTSSSAATDKRRTFKSYNQTNPFVDFNDNRLLSSTSSNGKLMRSAATQFPDLVQDKEVQASAEDELKEAPVLVYYPNYSLPDLSFLNEIFHPNGIDHIYLSPIKREPIKEDSLELKNNNPASVRRRTNINGPKKCRPKSYTDYEAILNQDLSHIKDWDSLNLLLPDDFKEFIEQNNILRDNFSRREYRCESGDDVSSQNSSRTPKPIKTMIPLFNNQHRLLQTQSKVKLRPHSHSNHQFNRKRLSLQENLFGNQSNNQCHYHHHHHPHSSYAIPFGHRYDDHCGSNDLSNQDELDENHDNFFDGENKNYVEHCMIRSQTMPNCQANAHQYFSGLRQPPPRVSTNPQSCCHSCCHSGCHSPSQHSNVILPPKSSNKIDWDLLSASNGFKKLLTFLTKLDEHSSESNENTITSTIDAKTSKETIAKRDCNAIKKNNKEEEEIEKNIKSFKYNRNTSARESGNYVGRKNHNQKNLPTNATNDVYNNQQKKSSLLSTNEKNNHRDRNDGHSMKTKEFFSSSNENRQKNFERASATTRIVLRRPHTLHRKATNILSSNNTVSDEGSGGNLIQPVTKKFSSNIPILNNANNHPKVSGQSTQHSSMAFKTNKIRISNVKQNENTRF
ncbi:hypothetical protein SSS_06921 [Sarcoptes scabiei]|uniref:Uncharacterized protein n=1 Tax=Sarcoptes scabiei TaxID=52283 RepID=A0A834VDU8_SARSC|nr:hypothetical protein SSS_06921 [Sarcoptes scabiei]